MTSSIVSVRYWENPEDLRTVEFYTISVEQAHELRQLIQNDDLEAAERFAQEHGRRMEPHFTIDVNDF
jgi:hypothetical protein